MCNRLPTATATELRIDCESTARVAGSQQQSRVYYQHVYYQHVYYQRVYYQHVHYQRQHVYYQHVHYQRVHYQCVHYQHDRQIGRPCVN